MTKMLTVDGLQLTVKTKDKRKNVYGCQFTVNSFQLKEIKGFEGLRNSLKYESRSTRYELILSTRNSTIRIFGYSSFK